MKQANYPIVQASFDLFETTRAALEEAFPGRVRQHEDCFYVDEPVSQADYNAVMDKLESLVPTAPIPAAGPSLTYKQKCHIHEIVRASVAEHIAYTNLGMVQRHYGTPDLRNIAHTYAHEVLDDIARSLIPAPPQS